MAPAIKNSSPIRCDGSTARPAGASGYRPSAFLFGALLVFASSLGLGASEPAPAPGLAKLQAAVIRAYASLAVAEYADALSAARTLQSAVEELVAHPSEALLAKARQGWKDARVPYSRTEVFRFCDGPIDVVETKINSWPIDENYIDYVAENPNAGVILDTTNFPSLNREVILSLNEKDGKNNISTGFHALEFLLWGQDLSPNGPGNRPWQDYAEPTRGAARRGQYLRIISALLVEHLEWVTSQWRPGDPKNYRAKFEAMAPGDVLASILKGAGALSGPELAGERLTTPYETKEQEEEQDCFSDWTCHDLVESAIGIQNVYLGQDERAEHESIRGSGIYDLLLQVDPALARELADHAAAAVEAARRIPEPFDQAILGANQSPARAAIKNAINAFQAESDGFARAAKALGLRLSI